MPAPASRLRSTLTLLSLAGLMTGCGETSAPVAPLHVVKGTVKLPKPRPIAGAKVHFVPDGPGARAATGEIKADGTFDLMTDSPGDGVAQGSYKVRFDQVPGAPAKGTSAPIPSQFLDEDVSGLTAVVTANTTEVGPFLLKPTSAMGRDSRGND